MQRNLVAIVFFTLLLVGIGFGVGNSYGVNQQKAAQLDRNVEDAEEIIDLALIKDTYKAELERVTGKVYTAKVIRLEGFPTAKVELHTEGSALRKKVAKK